MKINDLVNKVESFRFEFDGEVLEGTYYKYKTTTPSYAKIASESIPAELEDGTDQEKKANQEARDVARAKIGAQMFVDTIISWNAEDAQGNPILPSVEIFEQLPSAFTEKFMDFFAELRKGNPTSPLSPST